MKKGLFILLWAWSVFAGDQCLENIKNDLPLELQQLEKIVAVVQTKINPPTDFFAARAEDVKNAPCRRKAPWTVEEAEQELEKQKTTSDRRISKNVFGIELENESAAMISLLEKLLSYSGRFGMPTDEEKLKNQKNFKTDCKTVLCAVKDPKIFGPELGPKLLLMLGKFGYNGSQYSDPRVSKAWEVKELDDVMMGLSDYPASVIPISENKSLMRVKEESGSTLADARIYIFDKWGTYSREERQATIVHEVGHNIGMKHGLDECDHWMHTGQWKKRTEVIDGKESTRFDMQNPLLTVSKYAQTNPAEDFAESVAAYRYRGQEFKQRSPEKYQLLKNSVFDGIEYVSEEACQKGVSHSQQLAGIIAEKKLTFNWNDFPDLNLYLRQQCMEQTLAKMFKKEDAELKLQQCLDQALAAKVLSDDDFKKLGVSEPKVIETLRAQLKKKRQSNGLSKELLAPFQKTMRQKMVDFIIELEKNRKSGYLLAQFDAEYDKKKVQSVDSFCRDYATNSWLRAATNILENVQNSNSLMVNNQDELDQFSYQVCTKVQSQNVALGGFAPMTQEQIEFATEKILNP
jgi:hypothetical protein